MVYDSKPVIDEQHLIIEPVEPLLRKLLFFAGNFFLFAEKKDPGQSTHPKPSRY
jgi:hypothetical protein